MIPQQIIDLLEGTDVILMPPQAEGVQPTPEEEYVAEHMEALVELGMGIARDTKENDEEATYLLFNPEVFDPEIIAEFAEADALAEFVNGEGNNEKPENPTDMVSVRAEDGHSVRDVLVDSPEKAEAAIKRNQAPGRNVELNPFNEETGGAVIRDRIQNVGKIPNPADYTPR